MMQATLHDVPAPATVLPAASAAARSSAADCAWRVLEEIDYGLLLLHPSGALQRANHLAWRELARSRFLGIEDGKVVGQSLALTQELRRGLQAAELGRRHLLMLHNGDDALPVTCLPLFPSFDHEPSPVLLILGRQRATDNLNVGFFSRTHGLTPAEESVLRALCEGLQVKEIARARGVTPATVRTHVRSLREKTGQRHIRLLVQRVAMLPPVLPVLACLPHGGHGVLHQ